MISSRIFYASLKIVTLALLAFPGSPLQAQDQIFVPRSESDLRIKSLVQRAEAARAAGLSGITLHSNTSEPPAIVDLRDALSKFSCPIATPTMLTTQVGRLNW